MCACRTFFSNKTPTQSLERIKTETWRFERWKKGHLSTTKLKRGTELRQGKTKQWWEGLGGVGSGWTMDTFKQERCGGAIHMSYFCWASSRVWRRTWRVACLWQSPRVWAGWPLKLSMCLKSQESATQEFTYSRSHGWEEEWLRRHESGWDDELQVGGSC